MSGGPVERLREAIDALATLDPAQLTTAEGLAELLEELQRCVRRLEFEFHRILRAFDARGDAAVLGFATTAQFARHRLQFGSRRAAASVHLSRELVFVPEAAARWAAGDTDAERVRLVVKARTPGTEHAFGEWEPWLAEQASVLDVHGLRIVVKRWKLRADPDSDGPKRRDGERDAHVSKTFHGTVAVDATLPVVGGDVFTTVFDDLVEELFRADGAEAKARLGREPATVELGRTAAQRRADALVLMAERAHAADPSVAARLRPLVVVVTGLDALAHGLAEPWDRTPLTARQLAELLRTDPDLERFVYGPREVPVAHNPRHRLFTGTLRRAIQVRDRHCTALGCDRPARFCDVDHIVPVTAGGRTTPANGRVACGPDNRARPRRRFTGDPDPP